jgi:hypothetical protein
MTTNLPRRKDADNVCPTATAVVIGEVHITQGLGHPEWPAAKDVLWSKPQVATARLTKRRSKRRRLTWNIGPFQNLALGTIYWLK